MTSQTSGAAAPLSISAAPSQPAPHWQTARFCIELAQARVMGIVNVTPDSFSDGGQHATTQAALAHCEQLLAAGADILDIGGESTRPNAAVLTDQEELARVLPVLREAVKLAVPISVDTSSVAVMQQALDLGVDIINDVRALRRAGALACVAAHPQAGVSLMHMRGEPATMQGLCDYDDVVAAVGDFLRQRAQEVQAAGIAHQRIVLDPGIGFAKTADQCLTLLSQQEQLLALGWPLLVGWSRKSALGLITGRPAAERVVASAVAALLAVQRGAAIVRVHDVAATVDALKVWRATQRGSLAGQ
jgi:dihydropteroate synthase